MCNLPRPWPAFLADVDQSPSEPVELHCLGGFVLTAVYGIPRSTADIDYIVIVPQQAIEDLETIAGRDSALAKKHKVWLQLVGVADYPENYDSRLTTLPLGLKTRCSTAACKVTTARHETISKMILRGFSLRQEPATAGSRAHASGTPQRPRVPGTYHLQRPRGRATALCRAFP